MSDAKNIKFFHCHPCRIVFKTTDYVTTGDSATAICPVCESTKVVETSWRVYNVSKGWDCSTGPKTDEGKKRSSINGWKTGRFASQLHLMAPAKPGKFPLCSDCELIDDCKKTPFKYCPRDVETLAQFVHAYKEGKVNDLRDLAGITQAQMYRVFQKMFDHIMKYGVMFEIKRPILDGEGNPILDNNGKPQFNIDWSKNNLIKDLPAFQSSMGFSADLQDMTPKTRQETESIKGFLDDKEKDRQSLLDIKKQSLQEMTKMREAIKNLSATKQIKEFNNERDEQSTDSSR